MAEEEVVASPAPLDHKRKLEDLEPQAPEHAEPNELADSNVERDDAAPAPESEEAEPKRPRLDDKPDGSGIPILSYTIFL